MTAILAFVQRDLRVAWSYRFSFLFQNTTVLFSLLSLRFLSSMFDNASVASLDQYGGDYFTFVLLGLSVSVLAYPVIKSFANGVRSAQVTGTLEATMLGRSSPVSVVVAGGVYPLLYSVTQLVVMVTLGAVVFGANVQPSAIGPMVLVLFLTLSSLAGLGLFAAAFVIVFKQREPFSGGFVAASLLISGIMYPTSVLPAWMGAIAPLLPLTHSAELARHLFIGGAEPTSLMVHFLALSAFALLLPLGLIALAVSVAQAKRAGTLSQY